MNLLEYLKTNCYRPGEFTLASGRKSNHYFHLKPATLTGEPLAAIVTHMLRKLGQLPQIPEAIGGLAMGADFITGAVISREGHPTRQGSIVYKENKADSNYSIGNLQPPGTTIVVVDDVITTGLSAGIAMNEFLKRKYYPLAFLFVVDRQEGGKELLEARYGISVISLFTLTDFLDN